MKKTILLIFILGACILETAGDQTPTFQNGNEIYAMLQEGSGVNWSFAFGYIIGVHDAYNGVYFSSPIKVVQSQVVAIVKKYFENHPEKRHYGAASSIVMALNEAFPKKETPAFPQRGNNGND